MQLGFDFDPVHKYENNPISQAHLEAFRDRFSKDCFNILIHLVNGTRLTTKLAQDLYLSGDLRARIRDLRTTYKIPVSDIYIKTETGRRFKEFFMTPEDKSQALKVLLNKIKPSLEKENSHTREWAKSALVEGHKVRHKSFDPGDYIYAYNFMNIFNKDGFVIDADEYWDKMSDKCFETGWELFEKASN